VPAHPSSKRRLKDGAPTSWETEGWGTRRAMIRDNQFREDLFYRLNVFPIEIPPLRERREDIPLLVHYFVSRHSREMRKTIRRIPRDAMDALSNAPWPGNVRELENFIERGGWPTSHFVSENMGAPHLAFEMWESTVSGEKRRISGRPPLSNAVHGDSISTIPRSP
jgi:formate hydrogenlyase transcriptional activator